ncbi:MAG: ATP-binding protein [Planktothrix rubescens PR222]
MDFKNIEEVMSLLEQWVSEKTGKALTPVETEILKQSLEDKTYDQMEIRGYSTAYIKRVVSPKLWKHLSEVAGTPVNKKNCQLVLKGILAEFENKSQLKLQEIQEFEVDQSVTENCSRIAPQSTPMNPYFIGRENAIAHLKTKINQGAKIILIQAAAGIGKTTLATEFLKNQNFDKILYLTMAKERETISPIETIVEEWLRKDFEEEPGRDFMVSLGRLKRLLQNQKIGILIDNLEPALDSEFRFIEPHRRYIELLRMLTDSMVQSVTLITSRERLCEGDITVETYRLPELDYCAWKQYFEYYQINNHDSILTEMHKAYGGNAKAMRILCGAVQEDPQYQGDIQAYWNFNKAEILAKPDLKNLVNSQFNRLQELDINAFKLLCRLGCYRYQDVPTVPDNGLLCLLWDVPEGEQRRVIESLKNRSLVEVNKGEFFLHPMVREEAIARLRKSEDWETANIKAAEFWTESVESVENVQDALTAFEAYYHYLQINDFKQAGYVIEGRRKCKWRTKLEGGEALGSSFHRLGWLHQITYAINQIINNINKEEDFYITCHLNNLLGAISCSTGNLFKAIKCYQLSSEQSKEYLNTLIKNSMEDNENLKLKQSYRVQLANLVGIGLCQIDIWELEEAMKIFQLVKERSENQELNKYQCNQYTFEAYFCLAFLNSALGLTKEAYYFAEKAENELPTAWAAWNGGYSLVFLGKTYSNSKQIDRSFKMYNKARSYAEENHQPNFDNAIKLFTEIEAPRQVERVIKSII